VSYFSGVIFKIFISKFKTKAGLAASHKPVVGFEKISFCGPSISVKTRLQSLVLFYRLIPLVVR